MKILGLTVASAAFLTASSLVPASAITPAGIGSTDNGVVPVARVCTRRCSEGFCREVCRWEPNGPRVRIEEGRRFRAYGRDREFREERRGPGVELRIDGVRRD
jgi:hypothetical protein